MQLTKSLGFMLMFTLLGAAGLSACSSDSDGGGSGSPGGGTGNGKTLCEQGCAKSAVAHCEKQASCVSDCEAQVAQVPASCKGAMDAVMTCNATEAMMFACNAQGRAITGDCDMKGNALVACLQNPGAGSDAGDGEQTGGSDAGDGEETGSGGGGTLCEQTCAKAASANCAKQSSCVADCEADAAKVPASCKTQLDALQDCSAKSTTFACSGSGRPTTKDCDDEGMALVTCLQNPGGGGGDGGANTNECGSFDFSPAACGTCANDKCCAEKAACSDNDECGAILDCFDACNDNACFDACENTHPSGKNDEVALYACMTSGCSTQCK